MYYLHKRKNRRVLTDAKGVTNTHRMGGIAMTEKIFMTGTDEESRIEAIARALAKLPEDRQETVAAHLIGTIQGMLIEQALDAEKKKTA